jgi:hypothetical protein
MPKTKHAGSDTESRDREVFRSLVHRDLERLYHAFLDDPYLGEFERIFLRDWLRRVLNSSDGLLTAFHLVAEGNTEYCYVRVPREYNDRVNSFVESLEAGSPFSDSGEGWKLWLRNAGTTAPPAPR